MASPSGQIRVLHVDDDPHLVDTVAAALERESDRLTIDTATEVAAGKRRVAEGDVDCIVSDYEMPGQNGIEFLQSIRQEQPELPFILFTGKGSEEVASEAISAGVTDYLQKKSGLSQYTILANRIHNAVDRYRSQQAVENVEEKLAQLADRTDDVLFMFSGDWSEVLFVNDAYEAVWGQPVEAVREDPEAFMEHILPADHEAVERSMARIAQGESDMLEYRVRRAEDDIRWVQAEAKPIHTDQGAVERIVGIVRDITEQVERERQYEQVSERYQAVVEHSTDVISVLEDDGTLTYLSPAVDRLLGYDPDELVGESAFELVHPEDREAVFGALTTLVEAAGPTTEQATFRVEHTDGSWRWVEAVSSNRSKTDMGEYVVTLRDVTERVEYRAQLESVLTNLPGYVYRHRNESGWPLEFVKGSADAVTGYTGKELTAEVELAEEVIHPEDRELVQTETQAGLDDDGSYDLTYRIRTKDDEVRWVWDQGAMVEDAITGEEVLDGYVADITEQTERERQLRELSQFREAIIESANVWINVLDAEGSVVLWNEAAAQISGYSAEEVTGSGDIWEWLYPDVEYREEVTDMVDRIINDGRSLEAYETTIETEGGEQRVISWNSRAITDDAGAFEGAVAIGRDVTEERAQAETLARQNERLTEFTSVVSHDLRNPLNVAELRLELARQECESDHLADVAVALSRMNTLVEDLLQIAREGAHVHEPEQVTLDRLLEECWATVPTSEATIEATALPRIRADRTRVAQLLENLFRNAVEHGGEGVTIRVGGLADGFYVEDDGPGIPEADREEVFQAGFSMADGGTGFGLAIVRQVAAEHGWDIEVANSPEGGARFEITGVAVE